MRDYKRKTNIQSWSEENMSQAIQCIRNKELSYEAAAKGYFVPLSTLYRRCKKDKDPVSASKKSLGNFKPVFTDAMEKQLYSCVLIMEKKLFSLTFNCLRSLAYQFAERNNVEHPFNKQTKLAGKDWVYGFLSRSKDLSLRLPENTSFNRLNIKPFFNGIGKVINEYKLSASQIYNVDETGITTASNKPSKVFSLKENKQIGSLRSVERGVTVTAEICFNAAGHYIPPLLVYPTVREIECFEKELPPDSKVVCHPSGWMQLEIFAPTWFNHFLLHAKPSKDRPLLLILDGHAAHTKNLELVEMARNNHVHIVTLPPHCTHQMQPIDVGFLFPLSTYYEQETEEWLANNPGKVVTVKEIGRLFGAAYLRAATTSTAVKAFEVTGIYPFNPDIFPDDLYEPLTDTDKPLNEPRTSGFATPSRTPLRKKNSLSSFS